MQVEAHRVAEAGLGTGEPGRKRDIVQGLSEETPGSVHQATGGLSQSPRRAPTEEPRRAAKAEPRRGTKAEEDDELVQRCRQGDRRAFEAIYRRHAVSLYNLAYRLVGHAGDAEDLLQEVFLQVFNKLSGFRGQAALSTWLYRVATNRCLDHLRSKANRDQAMTRSLEEAGPAPAHIQGEVDAYRLDLERCIGGLPATCRAAFLLFDVEGYNHREVARILGVAEGTSKSLVHKARMKIRDCLGGSQHGVQR